MGILLWMKPYLILRAMHTQSYHYIKVSNQLHLSYIRNNYKYEHT